MQYGLIGKKLGHSYSKILHETLCDYKYELCQLEDENAVKELFQKRQFKAINVTIPYKKIALALCDEVASQALEIGAVNTVVNKNGKLYGYNTDYKGFSYLAKAHDISFANKKVLILGTGGTALTATAVCKDEGASELLCASRHPQNENEINYAEIEAFAPDIVINTTPCGMFPNVGVSPVSAEQLKSATAVLDAIYNPFCTEFLHLAQQAGISEKQCAGGLEMLIAQAIFAIEHFLDKPFVNTDFEIEKLHAELKLKLSNLCFIGMPSCGKTSLGKKISHLFGKTFIDIDEKIEEVAGIKIPQIFAEFGEAHFRKLEAEQIALYGAQSNLVISCGGGAVLFEENVKALKQNGLVVFIDRPLENLSIGGNRPLSKSKEALVEMEKIRRPIYEKTADLTLLNSSDFETLVKNASHEIESYF